MRKKNGDNTFPNRNSFCIYKLVTLSEQDKVESVKEWLKLAHDVIKPYTYSERSQPGIT